MAKDLVVRIGQIAGIIIGGMAVFCVIASALLLFVGLQNPTHREIPRLGGLFISSFGLVMSGVSVILIQYVRDPDFESDPVEEGLPPVDRWKRFVWAVLAASSILFLAFLTILLVWGADRPIPW